MAGGHWLKLDRADEHLQTLEAEVRAWGDGESSKIAIDLDSQTGEGAVTKRIDPLPPRWSLLVGDFAHNASSALDHLVYELACECLNEDPSGELAGKLAFPIFGPDKLSSGVLSQRVRAPATAMQIIQSAQPCERGNDYIFHPLWLLREINRFDKHRHLALQCSVLKGATLRGENMEIASARVWGGGSIPDGEAVLAEFSVIPIEPSVEVEVKFDCTFGIAFSQGAPGYGRYVIELLAEIRDFIANDVFARLDEFC